MANSANDMSQKDSKQGSIPTTNEVKRAEKIMIRRARLLHLTIAGMTITEAVELRVRALLKKYPGRNSRGY